MSEHNPWTTNGSRLVYENPWISLREDQVVQPDGKPGIYGVVHFKNKAIGVLAIDNEGNVILVGQFRYTLNTYSWEIPEGGCPHNEEPLDGAKRELLEETGFTAKSWTLLGTSHLSNSVCDEVAFSYLATNLEAGVAQPDGTEELHMKKVPFRSALAMTLTGEITDALSIITIQTYALLQLDKQIGSVAGQAHQAKV
jgi:8-oxo-dGTP pyrophosphatase MutT (NUDIX family)